MSKFEFNVQDWQAEQDHNEQVAPDETITVEQVIDPRDTNTLNELNIEIEPVVENPAWEDLAEEPALVVENPVPDKPKEKPARKKAGRPSIKKHMEVNVAYREAYKTYMDKCVSRKESITNAQVAVKEALAERKLAMNAWAQHIASLRLTLAEAKAVPAELPPRKGDY